jgi:altronate hydrolase
MASWLRAHPQDTVAVALCDLPPGSPVGDVVSTEPIAAGHKVALTAHPPGSPVIKLGHPIGRASAPIAAGGHVHTHNLAFEGRASRADIGTRLIEPAPHSASFQGYVRADGGVGTRNYLGILTSVNCSASVARAVARAFTPERLAAFPNVDGVLAFGHQSGCGMAKAGRGIDNLRRTLRGYALHPNFAGVLVIGLGCEVNQIEALDLGETAALKTLSIQDAGGTRAAIEAGIAAIAAMLPAANRAAREPVSAANLTLGLQCGASDGYSALTANPALGRAADLLVGAGGKVLLSETPEIFGAENLLLERTPDAGVAARLIERLDWWEAYAARDGADLDNNPSPGNLAGGITTILEKSLGAVAKAGTSPLVDVIDYGEIARRPGLSFMDTPGYDPCSATGQIAGGATLIAFTTGRGSVFGSKPAPTLKLASNSALAAKMVDDIDLDCGAILTGKVDLDTMGCRIFDRLLSLASGEASMSERHGLGDEEFVPWVPGAAM